jgi:hypothetical protein
MLETPPAEPSPELPISGFVLYTEDRTILVPTDGSPYTIADGLWLQDDRVSPPALRHTLDRVESRSFDARPNEQQVVTSLIGGWLLYQGWERSGAGYRDKDLYAAAFGRALIDEPRKLSSVGMRSVGCRASALPYATASRAWPLDAHALTSDCASEDHESEVFLLRRGSVWEVRDTIGGAGSTRWYLEHPARPDSCPSVNDPCGDPQPFRTVATLERAREYWIATDGSAALTAEGHAYALWRADASASLEFELPNIDASTDVIGVRHHANLEPLRTAIAKHPSSGHAQPERAPCLAQL